VAAFRKFFGHKDFTTNIHNPNLSSPEVFVALDVGGGLQWNADHDPLEATAKFGINAERRDTVEALFTRTSELFVGSLAEHLAQIPDFVVLRVCQTAPRGGRAYVAFEAPANSADLGAALARIAALLRRGPHTSPRFGLYKPIWTPGHPTTRVHFLEELEAAHAALSPVMRLLQSHM
jgi:hypothetical protein